MNAIILLPGESTTLTLAELEALAALITLEDPQAHVQIEHEPVRGLWETSLEVLDVIATVGGAGAAAGQALAAFRIAIKWLRARAQEKAASTPEVTRPALTVRLLDSKDGTVLATATIRADGGDPQVVLNAATADPHASGGKFDEGKSSNAEQWNAHEESPGPPDGSDSSAELEPRGQ